MQNWQKWLTYPVHRHVKTWAEAGTPPTTLSPIKSAIDSNHQPKTSREPSETPNTPDPDEIPEELRFLLPYAKEWAIGDDVERQAYAESVTMDQKKAFVDAVMPRMDMLVSFHEMHKDAIPVHDEVVLFDMMAEAVSELYYEVYPNGEGK